MQKLHTKWLLASVQFSLFNVRDTVVFFSFSWNISCSETALPLSIILFKLIRVLKQRTSWCLKLIARNQVEQKQISHDQVRQLLIWVVLLTNGKIIFHLFQKIELFFGKFRTTELLLDVANTDNEYFFKWTQIR